MHDVTVRYFVTKLQDIQYENLGFRACTYDR